MKPLLKYLTCLSIAILLFSCIEIENTNTEMLTTSLSSAKDSSFTSPGNYKLLITKDEIVIPFDFFGMNLMVSANINKKKVKLLIDNGRLWDETWFFNGEVDSINLQYANKEPGMVTGSGEDGGTEIREGNKVNIAFEEIVFEEQPTLISVPEAGYDKYFPGVNGQISSMLFKHFIVKFDFDKNLITLTKPEKFSYNGDGEIIPMHPETNGAFSIPITILTIDNKESSFNIDLDLGGTSALKLYENEKHNIEIPQNSKKELLGYGASGAIYGYEGEIAEIIIGKYKLDNIPTKYIEKEANADQDIINNGILGLPLMMRFNITFDYFNNKLYLEPNNKFNTPFPGDLEERL